jgi:hypothetical protein
MCQVLPESVQQFPLKVNGLEPVPNIWGAPPVDPHSVITSAALALEVQSSAPTASTTAVNPNLVIFSSYHAWRIL